MPTVKNVYNRQQVGQQRLNAPTRQPSFTPNDFGAQSGQVVSQIGQAVSQNAIKMRREDEQARVKQRLTESHREMNELLYLGDDAYYNRRGQDAYESYNDMGATLEEVKSRYMDGLSPRQQQAFAQLMDDSITSELNQMAVHSSRERVDWLNGQDEAIINQAQTDGALRYFNNEDQAMQIEATINTLGQRNGWSPEERAQKLDESLTTMHMEAVNNLLERDPVLAGEYFEANKDKINGTFHDDIQEKITQRENVDWVESRAQELRIEGGSRSERMERAREMAGDDTEKLNLLRDQITYDLQQERLAEQEASYEAHEQAYDVLVNQRDMTLSEFQNRYPDVWGAMDSGHQKAIRSALSTDSDVRTNYQAYDYMNGLIAQGEWDAARTFLMANANTMFSQTDFQEFNNAIWKKDAGSSAGLLDANAQRQFDDWIEATVGSEPTGSKTSQVNDRRVWNERRNILLGMYANGLTQDMTREDRRNLLDSMTEEYTSRDGGAFWFDREVPFYDLNIDLQRSLQQGFDDLGIPLTPDDANLVMKYDIDLTSPRVREALNALEELQQRAIEDGAIGTRQITLRDVISIIQLKDRVPVE